MLIKIPPDASKAMRDTLQQVDDLISKVLGGFNLDFKGRRVINAGDAVDNQDYVTRADVVRMIRASGGTINSDGSAPGQTGQAASSGPSAPQSSATTLAGDLARVSLRA